MFFRVFAVQNALLVGVLILAIGLWIYFGNRRRARNITLSALLVASAFWSFSHVLWRAAEELPQIIFWLKSLTMISTLLPALLFLYAVTLLRGKMPSAVVQAAALMPNLVFFWLIFGTDGIVSSNSAGTATFASQSVLVGLHFGLMFLLSLLVLLAAARRKSIDRRTLISTIFGSVLAFNTVFAVLILMGSYGDLRTFWLANGALAIGMLILALSAVGRRLIKDLHVIGGELFLLLVMTLVVTDVVVSESLLDFTFRLVLLVVIVFYGVIIMRSLVREVQRLNQVERLSLKLGRVNRELVDADKMKTRFLSFASHQLRSPLSGITSYMHMMHDGDFGRVTKKQKEVLNTNIDAMLRLRHTIETFLDVSKIEMGGLELESVDTNLELLAADVVRELNPMSDKKGLKIILANEQRVPSIMADSGKLYHALANLIDNAIKYTAKGTITVAVQPSGSNVNISVADTGRGMDKEQLKKIRLVMEHGLEEIRFDKEGGSGLGIHIARKIVEGHGGKLIAASSGKGKGSTFTIQIPKS